MYKRWKVSSHVVYNVNYHIIWATKYRRAVLNEDVQKRFKELIEKKVEKLGIEIKAFEIMEDHVHLFINANTVLPIHYIVQQLKGYTSKKLRQEYLNLRTKLPTLWTRSYYVETIGNINEDTIKKYIENQKKV